MRSEGIGERHVPFNLERQSLIQYKVKDASNGGDLRDFMNLHCTKCIPLDASLSAVIQQEKMLFHQHHCTSLRSAV